MKTVIALFLFCVVGSTHAEQPFGPFNQQYTLNQNQQYGSTNWYSSALGMGVAQAGVTLIGGLVNAMSRPDPVVYMQPQQTPVVIQTQEPSRQASATPAGNPGTCSMQTLYDRQGNPRYVKVCD
jgi:hypothetical protein